MGGLAKETTGVADDGGLAVVVHRDDLGEDGAVEDVLDSRLVDLLKRLEKRLAKCLLLGRNRTFVEHPLRHTAEEVDTPPANRVRRLVTLKVDLVDELLGVRTVVSGLAVHVAQDLGASDTNPVDARVDGVGDVSELEPGRHVGDESGLVREVDELERVLEADLEDDALGGVSVRGTVKRDLVKTAEGGQLDASLGHGDVVGEHGELGLAVLADDRRGEIVDQRRVEVVRRGEDLLVVAEDVARHGAHVRDLLGCGQTVHGDLGLGGAELEGGRARRRGEVDDLDEVVGEVARDGVFDAAPNKVLRRQYGITGSKAMTHGVGGGLSGVETDTSELEDGRDACAGQQMHRKTLGRRSTLHSPVRLDLLSGEVAGPLEVLHMADGALEPAGSSGGAEDVSLSRVGETDESLGVLSEPGRAEPASVLGVDLGSGAEELVPDVVSEEVDEGRVGVGLAEGLGVLGQGSEEVGLAHADGPLDDEAVRTVLDQLETLLERTDDLAERGRGGDDDIGEGAGLGALGGGAGVVVLPDLGDGPLEGVADELLIDAADLAWSAGVRNIRELLGAVERATLVVGHFPLCDPGEEEEVLEGRDGDGPDLALEEDLVFLDGGGMPVAAVAPMSAALLSEMGCQTMGVEGDMSGGSAFLASLAAEVRSVAPMTGETRKADPEVAVSGPVRSRRSRLSIATSSDGSTAGFLNLSGLMGGVGSSFCFVAALVMLVGGASVRWSFEWI
ncbi:LOW QUALITY PROTEIN: hypothetical protein JCM24511_08909 [Saitozyma sp. JCM 24511]|nr:LOW QUALITY PROTEIN: hypothetical protein JCM24511_08909 [Saitozyma sp. JCM 24511]